ncbi:AraC family transcriptional regulator [Burkholderia diffusa]|uniref:AraC family transcriptional regulator n=2 Tax=Burkholderia cepacia complex TaxID=87882 RepID=A0A119GM57_9BURK|nr:MULTISPECIES: DeoR/GlpR family DNA-binding transcription regulator [Burkholderia cepacia complex]AOI60834.1 AraC family transcriptional regulator [Burkholderia diffusa]KAB0657445.1 DeoR/GlpR transcriptional regulator [Burkholderia territorii]KUZ17482.1 AraC family transcriptional regulator [Burkholderia diffusa]KUZ41493.1 AraC family transcriptional regulator [Burkholderia territorii]KUZ54291.1 AraC family transcriptional regulator [Burkholderia territorii]
MLAEQRHQYILSELGRSGALSVAELVRSLDVSRETVRRDLNALAARGLLVMTHGGALAADRREPSLSEREAANAEAKRTIGRRAAEFVPDDASVLIDSGSTPHAVALALADRHRLSIYTNDWRTAFVLARRNGNRVTLLGGELSDDEDATFGLDTIQQLAQYHVDFAFVGAGGITADGDCTDYSRLAAEVRSRMIAAAGTAIIVADHSKFGRVTPVRINGTSAARYLVTERAPDKAVRRALTARGIELLVCD